MTRDEANSISIVNFDDNFQTLLRTGLEDIAAERGVDATQDALRSMSQGAVHITVFQKAKAQGSRALDAALGLARDEYVDQKLYFSFEPDMPSNLRPNSAWPPLLVKRKNAYALD